jgi:hypothetical protein
VGRSPFFVAAATNIVALACAGSVATGADEGTTRDRDASMAMDTGSVALGDGATRELDAIVEANDANMESDTTTAPTDAGGSSDSRLPGGSFGRVFFDDFESGSLQDAWHQVGTRSVPTVVTSPHDDGPGAVTGTHMVENNWNGTVAWNDPDRVSISTMNDWTFNEEFLIRFSWRADLDWMVGTDTVAKGPKIFRLAALNTCDGHSDNIHLSPHPHGGGAIAYNGRYGPLPTSYDVPSTLTNGQWHVIAIYVRDDPSEGVFRMWADGVLMYEAVGVDTTQCDWKQFALGSNWSGGTGCCEHDESNHSYWDDFEVYSDTGVGGFGSLSDGTAEASP